MKFAEITTCSNRLGNQFIGDESLTDTDIKQE